MKFSTGRNMIALLILFITEDTFAEKRPFVLRVLSPRPKPKSPLMAQLLPEAHLPLPSDVEPEIPSFGVPLPTASRTYSFCGENTRVTERLNLGYRGVNSLDQACLFHDLGYLQSSDKKVRKQLDWGLLQAATAIASNPSNPVYERSHAAVLANSLTAKIYSQ